MKLRKLEIKDAPLMLEWMHDESVCEYMQKDFNSLTIEDCRSFIQNSRLSDKHLHLAVTDDNDIYMGTVSLKNIDNELRSAEFAIIMRKCAMGKGFAAFGMRSIIEKGITEMNLEQIFWCVSKENTRADRFYDKNHCPKLSVIPPYCKKLYPDWENLNWYCVDRKYFTEISVG